MQCLNIDEPTGAADIVMTKTFPILPGRKRLRRKLIKILLLCYLMPTAHGAAMPQIAPLTASQHNEFSPVYSPDGLFIAFIREKTDADRHVWLKNLATATEWQLTDTAAPLQSLVFSNDGQSLTYLSRDKESDTISSFDVNFKKGLASVQYNQLVFDPRQIIGSPLWLDEDILLYLHKENESSITLMSWATSNGEHEVITRFDNVKIPTDFSVAPDKKMIAITFDDPKGKHSIGLYNLAKQVLTTLVTLDSAVHSLNWHPDSQSLLIANNKQLLNIKLNGEQQVLSTSPNQYIANAQYHPKKDNILMTLVSKSNENNMAPRTNPGAIVTLSLVQE